MGTASSSDASDSTCFAACCLIFSAFTAKQTLFACYGEGTGGGRRVGACVKASTCVRHAPFLHLGMTHATARPLSTLARPLSTQLLALFLHSPSFYTLLLCSAIARIVAMRRCIVCVCLCTCCSFQRSVCLKKNRALTNSKQQFLLLF